MQRLSELQSQVSVIRGLDAEVIALSCGGDERDVRSTRDMLRLTYSLVPAPITQVIKDLDLSTDQRGNSFSTVIIDKSGIVRFVHNSNNENFRVSVAEICRILKEIRY